jgi:hypothetical protein
VQVKGEQWFGTHWLLVQLWSAAQVPQSLLWPQPSPMVPQYSPAPVPHATGVHAAPPLHRWLSQVQPAVVQPPQVMSPPQPSPSTPPQYSPPAGLQVEGLQPVAETHWLLMQTLLSAQTPQSLARPQPSPMVPQ